MNNTTPTATAPAPWQRWPILAGVALAPVVLIVGLIDELAKGVVVAALIYVVWGRSAAGSPATLGGMQHSSLAHCSSG